MSEVIQAGRWEDGELPQGVAVGAGTVIKGRFAFNRFKTEKRPGLILGSGCTMDGVQFAAGKNAIVRVGSGCYFTNAVLLCELEIVIGSHVMMGWNAVIADSDFHPIEPAMRVEDAIACSPLGKGRARPEIRCKSVVIEDDVWIGPAATILKGVRVGAGAFIEPGTVVTRDVPARVRVMGNPAQVIGSV